MRSLFRTAGGRAATPGAGVGRYRCAVTEIVQWAGAAAGSREALGPGEFEFLIDTGSALYQSFEFAESIGPAEDMLIDGPAGDPPQLLARRADGSLFVRIALAEAPMRFVALGPLAVSSGTCSFEPQAGQ